MNDRLIKSKAEKVEKAEGRFRCFGRLCLIVFFIFASLLLGCNEKNQDEQISETRLLLDTYCTITIHGNVDAGMLDDAFSLCEELEALFSITIEGSDVWRINNSGGRPVTVDHRTIEVIKAGLVFGEWSDGMFDITIGRLSRLWDFGGEPNVPPESELNKALDTIDYRQVIISGNTVQLENPDALIDLGAIAKGFIAYEIAEFLAAQDVSGALIDIGRDVVAVGSRQDGNPWRIALQDPFGSNGDWLGIIEVKWASVLGSGTYERQFEFDNVRYHHILDPFTGMPVISDIISATVITETALLGEGLSTLAVLLGSDNVEDLFSRANGFIGAVIVLDSGELLKFGDVVFVNGG